MTGALVRNSLVVDEGVAQGAYDSQGRVSQVSTTKSGVTTVLASNFAYQPFGPIQSFSFGNGLGYWTSYDGDYRVQYDFSGHRYKLNYYDLAGNLTSVNDINNTQQTYGYDANNRLLNGNDTRLVGWGALAWTYDMNGNRLSETRSSTVTPYTYQPAGSNWLYQYNTNQYRIKDNAGNTAFATQAGFLTYDGYQRLKSSTMGFTYAYNALGQRTGKTVNGVTTGFAYGPDGQLLYEQDSAGNSKAYAYLNGKPLARIDNSSAIYYYHTDQLGAPQSMTDSAGTVVWKADYEPFGKALIRNQTIVNNLRLPGQYYDAETGFHYNYFRDYDPGTGRYVEFDPIGLAGGLNLYLYGAASPLMQIDPLGLANGPWANPSFRPYKPSSSQSCKDNDCITFPNNSVCQQGDVACANAMQAAGIPGPYYVPSKHYHWKCLATIGLVGKTVGIKAGNYLADKAPGWAAGAGMSESGVAWVARGAAVYSSPWTTAGALGIAIPELLKECECKE